MARRPSRKDKDIRFDRRCRQEEIRQKTQAIRDLPDDPDVQVMTFGEYQNLPIAAVPDDRLMYYIKWKWCPVYVGYELVRRGYQRSKFPVRFRQRMKADMKANGNWECKPPKSNGSVTVGEHYEWLRLAYLEAGGDESACPFGDDYSGPTLMYEDDEPLIYTPINKENAA